MIDDSQHTVVLDVMGADSGFECIVDGGLDAARRVGDGIRVVFVGRSSDIEKALSAREDVPENISIHHADDVIPMHLSATDGVRLRNSSVAQGLRLVKEGKADAFVSPGNTGAVMATALLTLGRIEGVSRPAITAQFPTSTGRPTVVLDVGANADCRPQHLSQFAVMGSVYSSIVSRIDYPRVGLVSIGEERGKGNDLILEAQRLLKKSKINFVGNIEGRDILSGKIDVAITDGFTGNILLKFAESIKPMLVKSMQRQIQTNIFSRVGAMLLLPFLKRMRNTFDYAESGGAPLLGVNGIVVICHGSSNARAITNAIVVAYEMATKRIKERIHDELITNHFGHNNGSQDKSEDNRHGIVYTASSDDQRRL
ncbi:MAG: phosphate acyltransferase PlsX [Candidatus Zixiibacteriota bacterium]|nr:MAG: phosphate acyltransferase PlsX [candidate division Zixibacteria bacterium]